MRGKKMILMALLALAVLGAFTAPIALAAAETQSTQPRPSKEVVAIVFSVAIVVGMSCMGAGYAVGRVGAAALGAASERPEILGRSLIIIGLAEGIAIYGLIIALMLIKLMS